MLYDASAGGGYDFFLELGPAGGPTFYWGYGGSYRTYSGPPLSTGWHHIAAVKEGAGNMGTLYIDGVPLTPDTGTSFGSMPAATNLQLGKYKSNQYYLNGNIDDVKIYNVALAPSAVCAEALKTWNGSSCVAGTPTVATPTISPAAGSYTTSVTVTLATATAGAQLRYTTNNTAPTATSTLYSAPFALTSSATVRAIGILSGYNNSLEASAAYTITTGGTGSWQTSGSNIYYTTGNVGIGGVPSSTANLRLQVTGDVSVSGNIGAKYQDVAEWVPSPAPLPAGTVVILDMEHNNQVIASTHAYDTKVAGVISSMPGLLLGIEGEGKVKVATTGRVKVKVDASKGAIKVGDLLVTSDVPGVAMRSEATEINGRRFHQPGTVGRGRRRDSGAVEFAVDHPQK
jgi:hypothetical protein